MAYIGNTATTQAFTPAVDYFNGDGATVAFTLSKPVASVAQVQAVIENVPQNPGSAYTVSGSTITFTSAPPSGTANIYVYYTSPITQVIAPSQGTVDSNILATLTTLPAPGGNTLTLPSASGVIDRLNRAGNVLQVVQGTTSTGVNSTSTAYADTGLSASITPTSATSKILVVVTQPFYLSRTSTTIDILGFKVLRDSTTIYEPYAAFAGGVVFGGTTSGEFCWVQPVSKLDSPATTSAITYKTQFRVRVTTLSAAARANADGASTNCESTIILMEIAA